MTPTNTAEVINLAEHKSPTKAKPAAKKTAKKSSKKVKAKTKVKAPSVGRGSYPLDAKISLVTKENPHRKGTILYKMFDKYKNGMSVQQALDAGIVWANLRYLSKLEHIKIK